MEVSGQVHAPGALPRRKNAGTNWTRGQVNPRGCPGSFGQTKILCVLDRASSWYLNKGWPTRWHLLYYLLLNMFQTLICPSSGACDYFLHCVGRLEACWCYVAGLSVGDVVSECRLQPALGYITLVLWSFTCSFKLTSIQQSQRHSPFSHTSLFTSTFVSARP